MRATHPEANVRLLVAVLASCILLSGSPALAEDEQQKEATIRELIEITGAGQMSAQLVSVLFDQMKPLFPHVPAEVWDELAAMLSPAEARELMVPIYAKHFELDELRALLAFYRSPTGQKMLAKMPAVMEESLEVGNAWGAKKAEELLRQLKERGFEPVQA